MSFLRQLQQTFAREYSAEKSQDYDYGRLHRQRLIGYREPEESIVRLEKPTNLARAHSLGYKAKKGFVVARVRIRKGSGAHKRPHRGRRPKRMGVNKLTRKKSIQAIAELRASAKYTNCEVLNSYWVGEDGKHKYFEVILVDTSAPEIKSDNDISWICSPSQKGRAERGLTSAAKKSRGLSGKGKGHEKNRPSLRARGRTGK
jgi:large subunit ribosomal protein L15e